MVFAIQAVRLRSIIQMHAYLPVVRILHVGAIQDDFYFMWLIWSIKICRILVSLVESFWKSYE